MLSYLARPLSLLLYCNIMNFLISEGGEDDHFDVAMLINLIIVVQQCLNVLMVR